MSRWVVFDGETAQAIRGSSKVEVSQRDRVNRVEDIVAIAAAAQKPAVLVLPSRSPHEALLVRMSQRNVTHSPSHIEGQGQDQAPLEVVATGFLGLTDEPVYEEQQAPPQKSKWRKLWD